MLTLVNIKIIELNILFKSRCVFNIGSNYLHISLSVSLPLGPSVCLFVWLSVSLSSWPSLSFPLCLFVCLSVSLSCCPSICLFICLSVSLSLCFSVPLSFCLSVFRSASLSLQKCLANVSKWVKFALTKIFLFSALWHLYFCRESTLSINFFWGGEAIMLKDHWTFVMKHPQPYDCNGLNFDSKTKRNVGTRTLMVD